MIQKRKNSKICGQQVNKNDEFVLSSSNINLILLENSIRGLEEDETDFLTRIDLAKMEKQRQLKRIEQEEIEELKISFFFHFIN
jgi:hypothetical protein